MSAITTIMAMGQGAVGTIVVDSSSTTFNGNFAYLDNVNHAGGQSFVSGGGSLRDVQFRLQKVASPTGNIYGKIYASTGAVNNKQPTGSALATSDAIDVSTLSTSITVVTFTFTGANQITLTASTTYIAVCDYATGDATNKVFQDGDSGLGDANGNCSYFTTIWHVYGAVDVYYVVHVFR